MSNSAIFFVIFLVIRLKGLESLELPQTRSYNNVQPRSRLLNSPCGGEEYNKDWGVEMEFKATEIKEGGILQVSLRPIAYSRNTTYRFVLCQSDDKETHLDRCISLSSVCFDLLHKDGQTVFELNVVDKNKDKKQEEYVAHVFCIPRGIGKPLTTTTTTTTATLPHSDSLSMTLIFEWLVSPFNVIYNCVDLQLVQDTSILSSSDSVIWETYVSPFRFFFFYTYNLLYIHIYIYVYVCIYYYFSKNDVRSVLNWNTTTSNPVTSVVEKKTSGLSTMALAVIIVLSIVGCCCICMCIISRQFRRTCFGYINDACEATGR
ncbi:hypothetical protein RFI_31300 [Reticulomyxa filosa]|uniref:Uncharacterized protein n=1 Tax=Reticulomyxa filosa TaxID=46433 RepID=X6LXK0_RETFI|nr:hypothetical protein RFI_31300 [Reticulomyxa filosa]|eukprot:ETO06096.1 hypothetical protein RFI_31300 [Reticulomyxa filosa]